ncbi:MAG: 2,3-bisphosphoglycerate-independent phosphoglycerate mutase [Armatimonadota bacterium]
MASDTDSDARAVLIIGDGMGGRPVPELDGRTTLEAAITSSMDSVARTGACGLMNSVGPGIRAGSDTSHLALLGYDPYEYYTGRGPYECAGIDMEVLSGDVAFRCNFATVDGDLNVIDRRAGRIEHGTDQLAALLNGMEIEGVTCFVKESVAHRAGLVLRGEGLGHRVTDVDPHAEAPLHECQALDPDSEKTARVVNEFVRRSYELLGRHQVNKARQQEGLPPANIMLPRGVGVGPHLTPFDEKNHLTSAMVVETGLVQGIGRYAGMNVLDVEGLTGGYDTDAQAFSRAILEAAATHTYVLANVKAPDIGGHDQDPTKKVEAIELVDVIVGDVLEGLDLETTLLVVTADHATPITVGDHSGDAVPLAMCGRGVTSDAVASFGERACAAGLLGHVRGMDLLNIITNLLAIQEKYGA